MTKEEFLTLLYIVLGSFLGIIASIPCILLLGFMLYASFADCQPCPPDFLEQWLLLSPIIFIFIGIINGMVGGIIFYFKEKTSRNARFGGFFGTLMGSGFLAFLLSIILFINAMGDPLVLLDNLISMPMLIFVGIGFIYLIVVLTARNFYRRIGSINAPK
jgi:hypothetical protein